MELVPESARKQFQQFNPSRREWLAGGLAVVTAGASGYIARDLLPEQPFPVSPFVAPSGNEVLGFLPHWSDISDQELKLLDTLAYFSVDAVGDGNIPEGTGYRRLRSKETRELFDRARKSQTQLMLTLTVPDMDSAIIAEIINNKSNRERAARQIITVANQQNMDAINIDLEYWGIVSEDLRNNFSHFVEDVSSWTDKRVTVSVYASSATTYHMFDIPKLGTICDGIGIMGYDFFNQNANFVAPTAPLYGREEKGYWYDVASAVKDTAEQVPSSKILLGIPQYGYFYPVVEDREMAPVRPSFRLSANPDIYIKPETLTMDQLKSTLTKSESTRSGWSDTDKVGWWSYIINYRVGQEEIAIRYMGYMEDERSIGAKCELVKKLGLGGIAFWASGFNSENSRVTRAVREKLIKW